MKVVSCEQMRKIDSCAIETGILGSILMENAAISSVNEIMKENPSSVRVFCGKGQNAGDGFTVARHLFNKNIDVDIITVLDPAYLSGDALLNYTVAKNMGIKITPLSRYYAKYCDVVVDAIVGTGLHGVLSENLIKAVEIINNSGAFVLSLDIPSGVNGNTGKVHGGAVKANKTVTFGALKLGLLSPLSADYVGEIVVADISIPKNLEYLDSIKRYVINEKVACLALPSQSRAVHKGTMGKTLIVGGSIGMVGSVYLASRGAERVGSGLVTIAAPEETLNPLMGKLTGAMCTPINENIEKLIKNSTAVLVGNGMGQSEKTLTLLTKALKNSQSTVVIDADGLNVLVGRADILRQTKAKIVITPHIAEMSRLTGLSIKEVTENRVEVAEQFAGKYNVTVVLKGANSVVATLGGITYINSIGNCGMARGGSGDILAGIIAGLAAKGTPADIAAVSGVYIHALAGDLAAQEIGEYSMCAEDIIDYLPNAIKNLKK